jgi:hypothetical protein
MQSLIFKLLELFLKPIQPIKRTSQNKALQSLSRILTKLVLCNLLNYDAPC